jgi:Uma2 family endonuclease
MAGATITESGTTRPGDLSEQSTVTRSPVPDDCFYEVVDGQIVELPPMGAYECDVASFLAFTLGQVIYAQKLGRVIVETMFWLDRSGKRKRRPDLAFVSAEKWPIRRRAPKSEAWEIVPDLAIEVVSESNSANEINLKLVDYFQAGVRQVWVIYPGSHQVYVYPSLTSVKILTQAYELDGGELIPGFRLSLTELFEDEPTDQPGVQATQ